MFPRALIVPLALVAGAALLGGCPGTPDSDTSTPDETDVPKDTSNGGGDADVPLIPPDVGCTTDAECVAATGPLPDCKLAVCEAGQCAIADAADGEACDDGNLCTEDDQCSAGECGGSGLDCDDGNACTTNTCDPASGCITTYNQSDCDDESACTENDRCFQGECTGDELPCDDGNQCTDDVCDPVTGCASTNNVAPCSDGDACTAGDTCSNGECIPGGPLGCGDDNPCVTGECDPALGCILTQVEGECDDANACTENDVCKDGKCTGDLIKCDDGNGCTSDYCDTATGCVFNPNTAACSDGDPCTLNDACAAGACVPGPIDPLCCDFDDECDDEDLCTNDSCQAGYCSFVPLDCDDGYECTADICVEGTCLNDPFGPLLSGPVITEGFEYGGALSPEWAIESDNPDVTWQLDTSKAYLGSESLYCGNPDTYTYEPGATLANASRLFALPPGNVELSFAVTTDLAETSCTYDVLRVYVNDIQQLPEFCASVPNWFVSTYDLSEFAATTVEVRFEFSTVDDIANGGGGVWIDEVVIGVDAPEGCCLSDEDCAGGAGCLGELCGPMAKKCGVLPADLACDDGDPCTVDLCEADGSCSNTDDETCCELDEECPDDDGLDCTVAVCNAGVCGLDESACAEPEPEPVPEIVEEGPELVEPGPEIVEEVLEEADEEVLEEVLEEVTEPGPEAAAEPGPEPMPEPVPEAGPEPMPEPVPDESTAE